MLRNDVLSHRATVETVNGAAAELLESSPGDEASHLRDQLDQLNHNWDRLLLKTQERQKQLEDALQQVETRPVLPFEAPRWCEEVKPPAAGVRRLNLSLPV